MTIVVVNQLYARVAEVHDKQPCRQKMHVINENRCQSKKVASVYSKQEDYFPWHLSENLLRISSTRPLFTPRSENPSLDAERT